MTLSPSPQQDRQQRSELVTQHERWAEARARMDAVRPPVKRSRPRPISPFRRDMLDQVRQAIRSDPSLATVYPLFSIQGEAGFLPSFQIVTPIPTWKAIALEVAQKHGVTLNDMTSARRSSALVRARYEAFWRCREETAMTLEQIGRRFGGRDHSTVIHGIETHERRMREGTNG